MNPEPSANGKSRSAAVIVAHPDDETLWAGGTILSNPQWNWTIISLSRASDPDRAPRFFRALQRFRAQGVMGDIDDGPEQHPLPADTVKREVLALLPFYSYGLVITHHPRGEYTRHRRHEEVGRAVINLWHEGKIRAEELWVFAYEDGHRAYHPEAVPEATIYSVLEKDIWQRKYQMITDIYGFRKDSWEAITTPAAESFWRFTSPEDAVSWLNQLVIEL
ncbi:PIG-L family deacetylase [Chitinophaga sp. 212800010-3]|uniref:PIG-L family deacetylase n=1 Tax=unclassified Chitinophaga TaxID=2619133 RepID=UPI002DE2CD1C|nr:LmbE family protein [Chitinophaga sp. 212800010-3]